MLYELVIYLRLTYACDYSIWLCTFLRKIVNDSKINKKFVRLQKVLWHIKNKRRIF